MAAGLNPMLRAVLFDFDGVIADSEPLHLEGFRRALVDLGIAVTDAQYYDRYVGLDDHDGFIAILGDNGREPDAATIASLMAAKAQAFAALTRSRVPIFPGVERLVHQLRGLRPAPELAIVSGALRSEIDTILAQAGLAEPFRTIVAADDVTHGKPAPDGYLLAMRRLAAHAAELGPGECVVVEDTMAGLQAARAAGMHTVGVATTSAADALEAELVVESLAGLDARDCVALCGG